MRTEAPIDSTSEHLDSCYTGSELPGWCTDLFVSII